LQSDTDDQDERWVKALREDVMEAQVELECDVAKREVTLRDIRDLKVGDVIPIEMPESNVITANGVPMFRVGMGQSRGHLAFKVNEMIDRSQAQNVSAQEFLKKNLAESKNEQEQSTP
jgi:flagellar motor switch protein FliM